MAVVSQKADERPIGFFLEDGVTGEQVEFKLAIRPEDLSRAEPSLQSATQTLGGAFIDDFGVGLQRIQIAGHTGWRTGAGWEAEYQLLHDTVWTRWHKSRREAVKRGLHPDVVKLVFVDKLDDITAVVAPGNFTLKRSKSRPLLQAYQIEMTVISDRITDSVIDPLSMQINSASQATQTQVAGVKSLSASLSAITKGAAGLRGFIDASLLAPVRDFMEVTNDALAAVMAQADIAGAFNGLYTEETNQLISVAADLSMVGRNIFYTYNSVVGLKDSVVHNNSVLASAYENSFCVLKNSLRSVRSYPDYTDVYGASVCSSTVGGSPISPLSGMNAFEVIIPSASIPPRVSADARNAISNMKATDPVVAPLDMEDVAVMARTIADGVTYA